jgi:formamidopyrimidine-DNA glycosylase
VLEGRVLEQVEILDWRWTRPDPHEPVAAQLTGARVLALGRHGKYMDWALDDDRHLLVHLRMTGAFRYRPDDAVPHERVRFALSGGDRLSYVDPRRFGTGHLVLSTEARDAYLAARVGVEPMTAEFTADYLRAAARGRTAPIKSFVLDQRRIAGVGNIYADEALFRAKIHPLRPAGSLTRPQIAALRDAIEAALTVGIESQGATIDDFRHVDGTYGSAQERFLVHLHAGEPCPECGTAIRKLVVGGRGTYVCERCQRRPRRVSRA